MAPTLNVWYNVGVEKARVSACEACPTPPLHFDPMPQPAVSKVTETSLFPPSKAWKVRAMGPNDTEQTKLSPKEWRDLILVEIKGGGSSRYCSAICPICLICYDVDILGTDASARAWAVEKVASHIKSAHSDALT